MVDHAAPRMAEPRPDVLPPADAIATKVAELGARIAHDYAERRPLLLVGVLKGSFIFLADLARQIALPHAVDFIALSSYGAGTQRTGEVRLLMDLKETVADKHVLVVEDIVDTGHTLAYLLRVLQARQPGARASVALGHQAAGAAASASRAACRSASGGECGSTMSAARPGTASQAASAASHRDTATPLASAVAATVRAWPQRSGSSLPAVTLMTRVRAVMLEP